MATTSSENEMPEGIPIVRYVLFAVAALAGLLALSMWGCPQYNVYSQQKNGQAELARAQFNRQITVLEAQAKEESAKRLSSVDSIRAIGVANANKIIGNSLKQNDEYLTWLWIESLKEGGNDVIYVPTEANLPVLEAGRFAKKHADSVKK